MNLGLSKGLGYVTFRGLVGDPRQIPTLESWFDRPDFPRNARWIVDNRELLTVPTSDDSKRLIELFDRFSDRIGTPRIGIVAGNDAMFGMGRVLEGWAGNGPIQIRTFRAISAARCWLAADEYGKATRSWT